MNTIDLTPSWESASLWLAAVLINGNPEGQEQAKKELLKMAAVADIAVRYFSAAKALLNGEFDNKYLQTYGELLPEISQQLLEMTKKELSTLNI